MMPEEKKQPKPELMKFLKDIQRLFHFYMPNDLGFCLVVFMCIIPRISKLRPALNI